MVRKKKLPPHDHVMRYVSWNKLRKNENDEVIGILGEAFKMRDSDKSLSTTWLEYFLGSRAVGVPPHALTSARSRAINNTVLLPIGRVAL